MALLRSISGLSFTGKCAVGAGLAFVGIGGAGAAGALPTPLQHGFSAAVSVVAPANDSPKLRAADDPTTTLAPIQPATTEPPKTTKAPADVTPPSETTTPPEPHPDPTTVAPNPSPEPTTVPSADGDHGNGNGEHKSPESISLSCSLADGTVHCSWSGDPVPDGANYILLKTGGDGEHGRALFPVAGATNFDDTMLKPGRTLKYMVIVVMRGQSHTLAHSNRVEIHVPTAPGTGTDDGANGDHHDGNKPGHRSGQGSGNNGSGGGHDGSGSHEGGTGPTPTATDGFGNP